MFLDQITHACDGISTFPVCELDQLETNKTARISRVCCRHLLEFSIGLFQLYSIEIDLR